MKIAIVGAGVSGLSLYLRLQSTLPNWNEHTVKIYESRRPKSAQPETNRNDADASPNLTDTTAVVGNSIALTGNYMTLLSKISPALHDLYRSRGYINENFTFRTARGWHLATIPTGKSPAEYTVSSPRYVLQECLMEVVGEAAVTFRKVQRVVLREQQRPVVEFADGGKEEFDLVVGADGIRSVVKKAVFGEEDAAEYAPNFEGFCGVGSFLTTPSLPRTITSTHSMVFTFGPTGSFGYCSSAPSSASTIGWWSNWGTPSLPNTNLLAPSTIRSQLSDRHSTWTDPIIQSCIQSSTTDRVYPIWTTPALPFWGRDGAVLLGDAAHTLQATSGQGAGQACEDSVTLSLLLTMLMMRDGRAGGVLSDREVIALAIKGLYDIRSPELGRIRKRAKNLYLSRRGIMSWWGEMVYYGYLFLLLRVPLLGQLLVGNVFTGHERTQSPEEAVEGYLGRMGLLR